MKIGFTIGKFAPLHKGHQFLIEKGLKEMDEFYVIIYETNKTKIPLKTRGNWIKSLYPKVNILYAYNPPTKYGLDDLSVKIQTNYLKKIIKNIPFTHFYSSEDYGKFVSITFNLKNVIVDKKRINYPISSTLLRKDLNKYINFLDEIVINDLIKKY